MKVLLINPPYQTITSNVGVGHQIPLGLLMVGGPLLDAGHEVLLLDAERKRLSLRAIVKEVLRFAPDVVMTGHAGSTPAHPTCMRTLRAIKEAVPRILTVYGGVYPTYHASQILEAEPSIDIIVRGEGEATAFALIEALGNGVLREVNGITYRNSAGIQVNPDRAAIDNLNNFRVGWELIANWNEYQCFGLGRAAIVQFSRGCPHRCTYCGQWDFWKRWRYRDPIKMADEIEWLHRTHGIRFCTLADENPTTNPEIWKQFLEELVKRNLPIQFFATIRATDIVRDADILPLYRKAGLLYVLMGIETTDPEVIRQIRKGSTSRHDYEACQLLKQHGIFSVIGHVVGLQDETPQTFRDAHRALKTYNGDYLNAMYVTPHAWSNFARERADVAVAQLDPSKWDYRHQVLAQKYLSPRQIFWRVKWLELCFHLRPGKLRQMLRVLLRSRDNALRCQLFWTMLRTSLVWFAEIGEFLLRTRFARAHVTLREFQGESSSIKIDGVKSKPTQLIEVAAFINDERQATVF